MRGVVALVGVVLVAASATPRAGQPGGSRADEQTLRIIVVGTLDEAERVVAQLRAGAPFADLAQKVSIDPTAAAGGVLGRVALSALRAELRQALQGRAAGDVTAPIAVPTGFAVLQIVADEAPGVAPAGPVTPAVAAAGSVKYVFSISGFVEAQTSLRDFAKPPGWNLDPRLVCELRRKSIAATQASLGAALADAEQPSARRMQVHYALGQLYAYQGRMAQAIEHFEQALTIVSADKTAGADAADVAVQLRQVLGVAYLHKAEMDNDVYHRPGERCLLTPRGFAALERGGDAEKAAEHFAGYLRHKPDELEVKWQFNLAHMTLGGYPDRVPPAHLIPPSALAAGGAVGRFTDVAVAAGLVSVSMAGGVIVDDFDNDGRFDVVTSSMDACGRMRFFQRTPAGPFVERGAAAGLSDQLGGLNMVSADYDNDGCLDILLLRGGWDAPQRKSLLRNTCRGTFTDVTGASGLMNPATSTQTAVWADIDNDGFLDLFVGNENTAAQLFVNNRDGTFTDIAERAGVARTAFTKAVIAGDYDNDGWPDLYVSNFSGRNFLYRNNRDRTFAEVAGTAGVTGPGKGFAAWFFDYDNDGWQDLFATSYFTSVDEVVRTYLKLPNAAESLRLYRNTGDGRFSDVTKAVGLDKVLMPMGSNFGDIDNDGFLDIFLGMGNPSYASTLPSMLLHNQGGRSFVDVTAAAGTGELHKGHGVAFADLDHDGDQELVFEVGGATPGDAHALRLFENPGPGGDWLVLKLLGVTSNRAAMGARVTLVVSGGDGARRSLHRTVGGNGSFGVSPLAQHVGLGRGARTVDVEIWWPASRTRQRFPGVAPNQTIEITELADSYRTLDRPPLRLGNATSRDALPSR